MTLIRDLIQDDDLPRLEVLIFLEKLLNRSRAWIIANDSSVISSRILEMYLKFKERRLSGEPVAYIIGYKEFMGHKFFVNRDVLVPRPETELLVEKGLEVLKSYSMCPRVMDLGVGCGSIAISIAIERPDASIMACDISTRALDIASYNAFSLSVNVDLIRSNWFGSIDRNNKFDVILSNPPYIAKSDSHLLGDGLIFEPRISLTDESIDGLDSIINIVESSLNYMNPGSSLWLEHGWNQAKKVRDIMLCRGFKQVSSIRDLSGIERVTGGFV